MLAHKRTIGFVAAAMALAVCLCLCAVAFSGQLFSSDGSGGLAVEYETALFDTSEVLQINIRMDEEDWQDMLDNATAEEYYPCDVEIGGETFYQVGIRPKGNTSLTAIASDPTTDRYSFKLEFDHYVDGQTCFGLDKLVLNNSYADATNMKEALIYDMFQYLGADASLYNYAAISVNGSYWGVYVALEAVEDSFLLRNYGAENGALYKPDSMDFGDIGGGGQEPPDSMPEDMPSFRFQYAAHLYNMAEPTSRPMATYTLEQICFSEALADRLLREKKDRYFHSDGCYLGPFFFTRYLPGEHKNYGGVAYPDHSFTSVDKDLFNGTVATSIYRELEFAEGEEFRYAGNSNAFWELRTAFDKSRGNDK